eukprot:gene7878-10694_t
MSGLSLLADDSSDRPHISGYLYRKGFFQDWRLRYIELKDFSISYSMLKGGMQFGTFRLNSNSKCEDNSSRHFCFCVTNLTSNESLFLAANNIAEKEAWIEAIQHTLSILRLAKRKVKNEEQHGLTPSVRHQVINEYNARPLIYIKIIRIINLLSKDSNGFSDPYVMITMGSSTVKTTTRKKNLNPVWGMVFPFDWDKSMRFVKVEVWDEDYATAHNFQGKVIIPIFSMKDGDTSLDWYPLGKRSSRSNVMGAIQIEIACSGTPYDNNEVAWQFYREVQKLPEMSMNLASTVDGSGQIALTNFGRESFSATLLDRYDKSLSNNDSSGSINNSLKDTVDGFPLYFPPIETEIIEDISLRALLISSVNAGKVACPGVLILTNYRVIFISVARIMKRSPMLERSFSIDSSDQTYQNYIQTLNYMSHNPHELGDFRTPDKLDLTTYIPISSIISTELTTDSGSSFNNNIPINYEVIRIRSTDGRTVSFLFQDDIDLKVNNHNNVTSNTNLSSMPSLSNIASAAQNLLFRKPQEDSNVQINMNQGSDKHTMGMNTINKDEEQKVQTSSNNQNNNNTSIETNNNDDVNNQRRPSYKTPSPLRNRTKGSGRVTTLESFWILLLKDPNIRLLEALDSAEGPPAHRFHNRLSFRAYNRDNEHKMAFIAHEKLLTKILQGCGQLNLSSEDEIAYDNRMVYLLASVNKINDFDLPLDSESPFFDLDSTVASPQLPLGWSDSTDIKRPSEAGVFSQEEPIVLLGGKSRRHYTIDHLVTLIEKSESLSNSFVKLMNNLDRGWNVYEPLLEYQRLGIPNKQWRVTEANSQYQLCPTYPSVLVVPSTVEDELLFSASEFRSKCRIPVLCWRSEQNNGTISRSSQPLVGLSNNRNFDDEILISEIQRCSTSGVSSIVSRKENSKFELNYDYHKKYVIVDARPLLNARAQQAAGKGVESDKCYENVTVIFMDIANIHAVRKSLEVLAEACIDEASWIKNLELSGWLGHIRKILLAAGRITHLISHENLSVLVHCSDGWDRTAQLTSLSMLLLDEYYRTLDGFIVLIEKEWISFGHKFGDRCGWTVDGWKDEERSPIFLQFLDCVHQCMVQVPDAFQFNQDLLVLLAEHINSGWFGNFFFNCEKDLKMIASQGKMISIWSYVLGNRDLFTNHFYYQHESPIVPVVTKNRLVIWSKWFLRWQDRIWSMAWVDYNQIDSKKQVDFQASLGWADDKIVKECTKCSVKFSLFLRKHHCRCCGQIFCEDCANEMRIIPAISKWRPSRVCVSCSHLLDDLSQHELNEIKVDGLESKLQVNHNNEKSPSKHDVRRSMRLESPPK